MCMHVHACACMCMHVHACECIHAYIHTSIHAYMHTCIHPSMHACIHAYMHACIHPYIHTDRQTDIDTYIVYIIIHLCHSLSIILYIYISGRSCLSWRSSEGPGRNMCFWSNPDRSCFCWLTFYRPAHYVACCIFAMEWGWGGLKTFFRLRSFQYASCNTLLMLRS